jgi:hypothetical protein
MIPSRIRQNSARPTHGYPITFEMQHGAVWPRAAVRSMRAIPYRPIKLRNALPGVPRPVTLSQPGAVCCVGEPE